MLNASTVRFTANEQPATTQTLVSATGVPLTTVSVAIAEGKRPVSSRTRKLSPPAPMVLHPGGCGRVGRRRTQHDGKAHPVRGGPFPFPALCDGPPLPGGPFLMPCCRAGAVSTVW